MSTIERFPEHKYAQCYIVHHVDGAVVLVSYRTAVVGIDSDGWLSCSGTYSNTTIRHIGWFMKKYGNGATYYTAKHCWLTDMSYNIYTGEIKPLSEFQ